MQLRTKSIMNVIKYKVHFLTTTSHLEQPIGPFPFEGAVTRLSPLFFLSFFPLYLLSFFCLSLFFLSFFCLSISYFFRCLSLSVSHCPFLSLSLTVSLCLTIALNISLFLLFFSSLLFSYLLFSFSFSFSFLVLFL